jgi:hypothetical protein
MLATKIKQKGTLMIKIPWSRKRTKLLLIGGYGGLLLFLTTTDPRRLPIVFLLLPVLWIFINLALTSFFIIRRLGLFSQQENSYKRFGYAVVVAALPTGLLLLNSINQLTLKDIGLIVLLAATTLLYVGRLRLGQKVT